MLLLITGLFLSRLDGDKDYSRDNQSFEVFHCVCGN